jgi:hypothetical protein
MSQTNNKKLHIISENFKKTDSFNSNQIIQINFSRNKEENDLSFLNCRATGFSLKNGKKIHS